MFLQREKAAGWRDQQTMWKTWNIRSSTANINRQAPVGGLRFLCAVLRVLWTLVHVSTFNCLEWSSSYVYELSATPWALQICNVIRLSWTGSSCLGQWVRLIGRPYRFTRFWLLIRAFNTRSLQWAAPFKIYFFNKSFIIVYDASVLSAIERSLKLL